MALRKGLDHTGVSVVYFCHDGRGRVLLAKRSCHARDEQGCWDIGGGGLEFGEPVLRRLRAEIREEYGTRALSAEFLGFRDVHRRHKGRRTHWVALDFKVRVDAAKAHLAEPHKFDAIGWFTLRALPKPLHSQLPRFLRKYRARLR